MTKEAILKANLEVYLLKISDISHGTDVVQVIIERAMDEYAKYIALKFYEHEESVRPELMEEKFEKFKMYIESKEK